LNPSKWRPRRSRQRRLSASVDFLRRVRATLRAAVVRVRLTPLTLSLSPRRGEGTFALAIEDFVSSGSRESRSDGVQRVRFSKTVTAPNASSFAPLGEKVRMRGFPPSS
jgi:hypothetical protein